MSAAWTDSAQRSKSGTSTRAAGNPVKPCEEQSRLEPVSDFDEPVALHPAAQTEEPSALEPSHDADEPAQIETRLPDHPETPPLEHDVLVADGDARDPEGDEEES